MIIVDKFVNNEIPTGTIDGANKAFVLERLLDPDESLEVFLNGKFQVLDSEYTVKGMVMTFDSAPLIGSILKVNYRYKEVIRHLIFQSVGGVVVGTISMDVDEEDTDFVIKSKNGDLVLGAEGGMIVTVAGDDLQLGSDIYPSSNNQKLCGKSTRRWSKTWTRNLDVDGLAQVASLRIDQTPTAEVNTATHYVTINLNGTDYKLLLKSI